MPLRNRDHPRRQRMGWAILASAVVIGAIIVHNVPFGKSVKPSVSYRVVSSGSRQTVFSSVEAQFRSEGVHHGITVRDSSPPEAQLVWWGRTHPTLCWLLTFRDARISRHGDLSRQVSTWIMVMNANTGTWLVSRSGV